MKQTIYYAHFMGIYNTPQEKRDIATLEALGFEVYNPNNEDLQMAFNSVKLTSSYEDAFKLTFGMAVIKCSAFAFRALPDGTIPAGIMAELKIAQTSEKPILELPSFGIRKVLTGEETRTVLKELGQR